MRSEFFFSIPSFPEYMSGTSFDTSDETLGLLGKQLMDVKVGKAMIAWNLEELELAAQEAVTRERDSDDESE